MVSKLKNINLKKLFRVSIGLVIFAFVIWKIGPCNIIEQAATFKIPYLAVFILLSPIGFLVAAVSVTLLGRTINCGFKWRDGIKGFLATVSLSIFLPGRVGDLSLPYFWRGDLKYGESMSVMVMDKVITMVWIIFLGSCGIYALFDKNKAIVIGVCGLSSLFFVLLVLSWKKARSYCYRIIPLKIMDLLEGFINAFRVLYKKGRKNLLIAFFMTGARLSIYGISFWLLLRAQDLSCPVYYPICIAALAQLTSILPISIMGLGTVEAVYIVTYNQLNISASAVVAANLFGRIVGLIILAFFFFLFASARKIPLEGESKARRE